MNFDILFDKQYQSTYVKYKQHVKHDSCLPQLNKKKIIPYYSSHSWHQYGCIHHTLRNKTVLTLILVIPDTFINFSRNIKQTQQRTSVSRVSAFKQASL